MAPRHFWSKRKLAEQIVVLYERLGYPPTVQDLRAAAAEDPEHFADYSTFRRHFKNKWGNALAYAGFEGYEEGKIRRNKSV